MQITTGVPGEQLAIAFQLDNNPFVHTSFLSVPPQLYAGVNFVDYLSNVAAGTHTLRWWAKTTSGNASVEWRNIEFVSFPAYQGNPSLVFADATSAAPVTVSTSYGGPQPSNPLLQGCGSWTPLLTLAPATVFGFTTVSMVGYVQISGSVVNPGPAQFAITHDQAGYELGIIGLGILNSADGYYFFSDGSNDIGCAGCTITLWARKVADPACVEGAGPGSFAVGLRYLAAKWTPMDGCRY
jgi:hypothetical protein